MTKSILFWTIIVCAVFLTVRWILSACGLQFRIWIREPVTLLIAAGLAAGLLQRILSISGKKIKIVLIVLWAAALIGCCVYGFFIFALTHRSEVSSNTDYNGTRCVVEHEPVMWESRRRYYAYRGWFVRGKYLLHKEGYACGTGEPEEGEE
ncbi:MAG: hypothetical protein K5705_03550 [Oscillospiraceae bacterium]|nr:hypothetical protein [Oscillospiraceae bacterium]MCR4759337.1 hypothetical protein [Oscillospiraceae bacterium]